MTFQQYPSKGGVPSGNTAGRPTNPVIGDTYYNGQLEIIEIYNGTAWVALSAPAATPSIVSVTDASTTDAYTSTAGKLTVVLQAGVGGSSPTSYNVFTTAGGHTASSSSSTVTLTGLTPGTGYTVYANAQNNFGTTVNTPNFAERTPTTLPEVRTIGTASTSSVTSDVTVTWTNGNNGGKNLTSITITPFLNGTTAQTSQTAATTSSTSHTFTGLTQGSSYTFKVKATNANGTCADSTATNSVTLPAFMTVDYLVIAGGGGGGRSGGGGGAGGYRTTTTTSGANSTAESALTIAKGTNYTVTVGAGGTPINNDNVYSNSGDNSVFSTITSSGGGGGGSYNSVGNSGGSGGGRGDASTGAAANGTANQGSAGGLSATGGTRGAGGGGGASAAGGNGSGGVGANGGNGLANSITGSSVTRGGGGGGSSYSTLGTGGTGGGGNAGDHSRGISPTTGTANTGGGGGGGNDGTGAAGGSGVVILRWLTSDGSITVGAGLTADSTGTDGSYSYKRFTAGSGNVSIS
jgi:hypothetical protein